MPCGTCTPPSSVSESPQVTWQLLLFCRILLGEVEEIHHRFMVPGHTKSLLDGRFGVIKNKCKRLTAYSPRELVDALNGARLGAAIVQSARSAGAGGPVQGAGGRVRRDGTHARVARQDRGSGGRVLG